MSVEALSMEWVIAVAILAALVGAGISYLLTGGARSKARVAQLEQQLEQSKGALESSQSELADYKREVFDQFAETAQKFRALDQSYHDLHRQLAQSSVALCGDAATPLLEGATTPVIDTDVPCEIDAEEADDQISGPSA